MLFDGATLLAGSLIGQSAILGASFDGAGFVPAPFTMDTLAPPISNFDTGGAFKLTINITAAPTSGTSVRYQFCQSDDADLTVGVEVVTQTGDIPIAQLVTGSSLVLSAQRAAPRTTKRFIGFRVLNVGAVTGHRVAAAVAASANDRNNLYLRSGWSLGDDTPSGPFDGAWDAGVFWNAGAVWS